MMQAEIVLRYENEKVAEAIAKAVSPDNVKVPKGLKIETWTSENNVITSIIYEEERLGTFISTIDDLLSCITVVERTFAALQGFRFSRKRQAEYSRDFT
ncbi:KEOPS complex subunit [Candidatus Bathyarchaeota archaeon]|nr:MAG: KEOPS complex subunit [Candidatus Bathyarchaeota archaeon]